MPSSRSTWSGTPSAICAELARRGLLGMVFRSSLPRAIEDPLKALSKTWYLGSRGLSQGRLVRRARALKVAARTSWRECEVLHMGRLDMPLFFSRPRQRHFLYCDATWHTATLHGADRHCTPALLRDVERLDRRAYSGVRHIFTTSGYVRDDLIGHYGVSPSRVTAVGTGQGRIAPFYGEKDYTAHDMLFVAKHAFASKGGHLLLEGFRIAQAADPRLRLTIVGDPRCRDFTAGVPNVTVHGYLPWEDLQRLYARCTLFCMPAANEPWGLVYIEALSCQMPILGLRRNALPELTAGGKYGFLLDEETPAAVARAMRAAYADPSRLRSMGREGQRYCRETFSWERTVDRMLSIITSARGDRVSHCA
jgi:glycosyltransferase involved in cell wall biosynthesis